VDLLMGIVGRLGVALRCEPAGWDTALAQLQAGRLDMLCRAVTITPERRRLVDFSDPYLETELSLVIRRGSPIQGPGDLIGLVVGVRRATTAEEFVRAHAPAAILRTFDGHAEAHRALSEREVDAVVDHTPIARHFASEAPGLRVSGALEGTGLQCGMVLASGHATLRRDINRALAELRSDGTWERHHRRWFAEGGIA
jgi:polar amino acid transport system substrate-binding protein